MFFVNLLILSLLGTVAGQLPPKPEGVTVLKSKFHENVTISFKEVRNRTRCPFLVSQP